MILPQRICVPTDFSPLAEKALAYATGLVRATGGQLHLLHILRSADDAAEMHLHPDLMRDSPEVVNFLASLEGASPDDVAGAQAPVSEHDPLAGIDVVRATRVGDPVQEIVTYAKSHEIDLLVMGSHGRSNWEQLFAGSVTSGVLQKAPCLVLVVPRGVALSHVVGA